MRIHVPGWLVRRSVNNGPKVWTLQVDFLSPRMSGKIGQAEDRGAVKNSFCVEIRPGRGLVGKTKVTVMSKPCRVPVASVSLWSPVAFQSTKECRREVVAFAGSMDSFVVASSPNKSKGKHGICLCSSVVEEKQAGWAREVDEIWTSRQER